ncbi:MAG: DnaD domain protein [Bacillus sp. (in: Bacteria)]|nr:DnaD domain protein [Bacillus sp. (in: firmicutes)]MCM1425307.1 DnaD domain protein [Eubacterium sp.]
MSHLTIYQDNYTNATVISNRFIDEYMKAANDAQLKIYLYLIRMMSARLSTSVSDIADIFNYTEKDVLRALKYWEKNKLLTLDYDDSKNLTGIHLLDLNSSFSASAPVAESTVPMYVLPISSKASAAEKETQEENPYEKPSYTLDQLKAFKSDEATSRLLFITEQYLKKTLSANEMKSILFISDRLGFSEDLIDYLIQYCVDHGKKDLRYIEKVAINWAQEGVTTPEQATRYVHKYDKTVYDIMKALGKSNAPTQAEISYITRWTKEFAFEFDVINAACEKTVLATDKHRFEYADSILNNWFKAGIHHKRDIQAAENQFRQNKTVKTLSANKFNQFKQNQYDFDELEQELLSN